MSPTKFALDRMNASLSKSNQNIGGSSVPAVTPVDPAFTSSLIKIVVTQVSQKNVFHCVPNADPFEVGNINNGIRHQFQGFPSTFI